MQSAADFVSLLSLMTHLEIVSPASPSHEKSEGKGLARETIYSPSFHMTLYRTRTWLVDFTILYSTR